MMIMMIIIITDTTIPPQPSIPQSYVSFRNDSLKVLPSNLTWFEAQKACEEDQAHLVSIRDAVTQAFIQLQAHELKQPIWIGLNKNLVSQFTGTITSMQSIRLKKNLTSTLVSSTLF